MSDGPYVERVIAGEFARRLGLAPDSINLTAGGEAEAPKAVLGANGKQIVLELAKAKIASHAHAHDNAHHHDHDHHDHAPRSAGERLDREFHHLPAAERPFDVFIRFEAAGCCGTPHLPRSSQVDQFLAEIKSLTRAAQKGELGAFQNVSGRSAPVLSVADVGGLPLLSDCNAEISFSPVADLQQGGALETDFDAVSMATADIAAIVAESTARDGGANWLVIYEWDVLGAIPDVEDLPALPASRFERVFLLNPHSPGFLREWLASTRRWQDVAAEPVA